MCGRIAFVKEIVPTVFKSRRALSTSRGVFFTRDLCDRAPLLTKTSSYKEIKLIQLEFGYKYSNC